MLQMRGRVHRKLARLQFAEGGPRVTAGAEVELDGASIGKVTSVAHRGGRAVALAMLKSAMIATGKQIVVAGVTGEITGEAG